MFLAAIGLGGMYFKKSFPIVQLILSDILLIVMSTLQPDGKLKRLAESMESELVNS